MKLYEIKRPGDLPLLVEEPETNIILRGKNQDHKEEYQQSKSKDPIDRTIIHIIGEPIIKGDYELWPKKVNKQIVLVRKNWNNDGRALVIIKGGNFDNPGGTERISDRSRNIKFIKRLSPALSQVGDCLVILPPGAEFCLDNINRLSYWYKWDKKGWFVESREERKTRLASKKVEQESGEWL